MLSRPTPRTKQVLGSNLSCRAGAENFEGTNDDSSRDLKHVLTEQQRSPTCRRPCTVYAGKILGSKSFCPKAMKKCQDEEKVGGEFLRGGRSRI